MEQLAVHGLVVRETDVGEYDKILTLVTREVGKITITAKGAKSLKNRNMINCQPFAYAFFLLRRTKKYYYLVESDRIETFYNIRYDLNKIALATYFCDVAAELSVEGMGDPELLRITLNSLYALDTKEMPMAQIKAAFEIKAASVSGFMPDLVVCGYCGCDIKNDCYLDIMNGRLLCKDCKPLAENDEIMEESGTARLYMIITPAVLAAMRFIIYSTSSKFLSFTLDEDELYLLSRVAETYIINQIEHKFYTLDFYKELLN